MGNVISPPRIFSWHEFRKASDISFDLVSGDPLSGYSHITVITVTDMKMWLGYK